MCNEACENFNIPAKYIGKTFGDYSVTDDNRRAVQLAKIFCEVQPNQGLYFFGNYGTGKTFLAALIAQQFVRSFKRIEFGDVPALLHEIKRSFDNPKTANPLDRYCECDLLFLDDLGAGQITEWNVGQIYQIINARYSANKPVIVTSNFNLKELEAVFGKRDEFTARRIISRLSEMCTFATLGTHDRRKQS